MFANKLVENSMELNIPNLDPEVVVNAGAKSLKSLVDPSRLAEKLTAYNGTLIKTFQRALVLSCLGIFGALNVEWKISRERNLLLVS
ncbi:hypothetical protein EDB80DRAFT_881061 [Ilyonectria destructans]|nr:hypothetical protein EDB80DRAFT_881061 [Ilyonectria destructans]